MSTCLAEERLTDRAPQPLASHPPLRVVSNRSDPRQTFGDHSRTPAAQRTRRRELGSRARCREAELDRVLIARAQAGDREAFRELVLRHQRRAYSLALGLVRDEGDAQEVVQEAFIRVFRGLRAFQNGSSFFTWLYRIVNNLAIDHMRRPHRRDARLDDHRCVAREEDIPLLSRIDGADPLGSIRRQEIAQQIQMALDALPPYHRAVIIMRELEGLSYQEMADAMAVSKGTIMSRLFHARRKLQVALASCYDEQVGTPPIAASAE